MKPTKLTNGINLYVASLGEIFKVIHVFSDMDSANLAMTQNRNLGIIAEDNNGFLYLAEFTASPVEFPQRYLSPRLIAHRGAVTNL